MKVIQSFKAQTWQPQHEVVITSNADVLVDGVALTTETELALANTILHLNGVREVLQEKIAKLVAITELK